MQREIRKIAKDDRSTDKQVNIRYNKLTTNGKAYTCMKISLKGISTNLQKGQ